MFPTRVGMNRYTSTASRQPRVVNQKTATHPKTQNLKRRIPLTIGGKIALTSTFTMMSTATSGWASTNPMTVHQRSMTVHYKYCHGLRSHQKHPTNSTPITTTTYHDAMTQKPETFSIVLTPNQPNHKQTKGTPYEQKLGNSRFQA